MIEVLSAAARWFQLTANLIILGSCVFLAISGFNKRVYASIWVERLESLLPKLALSILFGLVIIIITTIAMISGDVTNMINPEKIREFIASTRTGTIWLYHFVLAVLLYGIIKMSCRGIRTSRQYSIMALFSTLPLVADAMISHVATANSSIIGVLSLSLHIIFAGVWLGGLPALLLLKYEYVKHKERRRAKPIDIEVLKRFSSIALPVMLLIVATGLWLGDQLFVDNYAALVATPYGWLLLAKVFVLALVVVIASSVRSYWLPLFSKSTSGEELKSGAEGMRKWVRIEFFLALAIVLIATVLANNAIPAKHALIEEWPFPFRFSIIATWNNENVQLFVWSGLALIVSALGVVQVGRSSGWGIKRLVLIPSLLIIMGLGAALPPLTIEAYPETYQRPPEMFDAISIAYGAQNYAELCVDCHGRQGKGDGIKSRTLSTILPDMLTEPHTTEHTPGDFYHWITHGMKDTDMPGYKDKLSEEERWDMVNYVFALSRGYQARILSPEVIPNRPNVQPPVFSYVTLDGSSGVLQEFRFKKPVLLVIFSWPNSELRIEQLKNTYSTLADQNVEVLLVPTHELDSEQLETIAANMPYKVIIQNAMEIAESYALSRRTMTHPDLLGRGSKPDHMEFLIDSLGYLRARWIPSVDEAGWDNIDLLSKQIEQLNNEKSSKSPAKEFL